MSNDRQITQQQKASSCILPALYSVFYFVAGPKEDMARPPEIRNKEVVFCFYCPVPGGCNRRKHRCLLRTYAAAGLSFDEAYQVAKQTIDSERYNQYEIVEADGQRKNIVAENAYRRMIAQMAERAICLSQRA